jgi:sRNA-binding regulator protein Hfq
MLSNRYKVKLLSKRSIACSVETSVNAMRVYKHHISACVCNGNEAWHAQTPSPKWLSITRHAIGTIISVNAVEI